MVTGSLIPGRPATGTVIVCTPEPGMLNAIVSGPAFAFASVIACCSDPAPVWAVLVTLYVFARARAPAPARTSPDTTRVRNTRFRVMATSAPAGRGGRLVNSYACDARL